MDIQRIRGIRTNPSVVLKPSPYLKKEFTDDDGVVRPVELRNYQAQGVLNLLTVTRMILGDDTGLGKTLQVLTAIGYVWMVEPEYVPIVVARKSALYQWAAETDKFMQNMSTVVVDGEPWERDAVYEEFFAAVKRGEKKILLTTYNYLLKDFREGVVKDKSYKATKEERAALRTAMKLRKERKKAYGPVKAAFKARFDGRDEMTKGYIVQRLKPSDPDAPVPPPPPGWDSNDARYMDAMIRQRDEMDEAETEVRRARDVVEPPTVVPGIHAHMRQFLHDSPGSKFFFVMDEMHVVKNYKGKISEACQALSALSERAVGMTATPVKNRLMEFFGLFRVIHPALFPKVTHFQDRYCIIKMQPIGRRRKVPVVVGHSNAQLEAFVAAIEPFYLSRRKHDVAKELPELVTRERVCVLSDDQEELYSLAEAAALETTADPDAQHSEVLRVMTMVRQACNAPQLLMNEEGEPFEGESSKVEELVEILKDSPDTKTLIYSQFEKMISLFEKRLKKEKIDYVRITGKENKAQVRHDNVARYRDPESGCNVMMITSAGSESLNLQATEHTILIDSPFSWGDYVQLIGRSSRIGSKNATIFATHLVARRRNGEKTIDDYIVKILRTKRKLADKVAGESLKSGLEFTEEQVAMQILDLIREDRRADVDQVRQAVRQIRSTSSRKPKKKAAPEKKEATKAPAKAEDAVAPAVYIEIDLSDL